MKHRQPHSLSAKIASESKYLLILAFVTSDEFGYIKDSINAYKPKRIEILNKPSALLQFSDTDTESLLCQRFEEVR